MRSMARVASILLTLVGVLLIAAGVAMPITSDAELWWVPAVVGAGIALIGVLSITAGGFLRRAHR